MLNNNQSMGGAMSLWAYDDNENLDLRRDMRVLLSPYIVMQ